MDESSIKHLTYPKTYLLSRVKFSNFYLLIGWKIKSYLANSEKFWPFGLYEGHKAKKGPKKKFWQMNQNSLIHGEN